MTDTVAKVMICAALGYFASGCFPRPLCNLDLPDKMPGATPTAAPRTAAPQQQQQQQ